MGPLPGLGLVEHKVSVEERRYETIRVFVKSARGSAKSVPYSRSDFKDEASMEERPQ